MIRLALVWMIVSLGLSSADAQDFEGADGVVDDGAREGETAPDAAGGEAPRGERAHGAAVELGEDGAEADGPIEDQRAHGTAVELGEDGADLDGGVAVDLEVDGAEVDGREDGVGAEDDAPRDGGAEASAEMRELGDALRQREAVRPWHVVFGTMTGVSTYAMTLLGYLTFNDRYGWDGDPANTGCASGSPIFGSEGCAGPPLGHLVAVSTASTLFAVAFTLALFMPDPLHVDETGEHATLLTVHEALRWALLVLFVGQLALGAVTANVDADFDTRRALASTHLAIGTLTMFTMTTQGILGSAMEW